jgi:pyruvate dehydrogenase (quinone)
MRFVAKSKIECVHVRHEEVAAFAAAAEAHLTSNSSVLHGAGGQPILRLTQWSFRLSQIARACVVIAAQIEMAKGFSLLIVKELLSCSAKKF